VYAYLEKPNISISMSEYRLFYINNEVKEPGSYPYRKDLTIQKVVALTGGLNKRASSH
jgi:polysaccharide export outer membrane protein